MTEVPATTIKLTAIEPCGKSKVCITAELVVDVHQLAEVGSDMLRATIGQLKDEKTCKQK